MARTAVQIIKQIISVDMMILFENVSIQLNIRNRKDAESFPGKYEPSTLPESIVFLLINDIGKPQPNQEFCEKSEEDLKKESAVQGL